MFGRKKSQASVSVERVLPLREILGCDELEPPESRLQRATFVDLFDAQNRAQLEQWKGNGAASGALSLLYDEAGNRDIEHRFLLQEKQLNYRDSLAGLFIAYGQSKDLFGEERIRELSRISGECRDWISAVMIMNRAVQQELRLSKEIYEKRIDDDDPDR
jgi:hypothetical protein